MLCVVCLFFKLSLPTSPTLWKFNTKMQDYSFCSVWHETVLFREHIKTCSDIFHSGDIIILRPCFSLDLLESQQCIQRALTVRAEDLWLICNRNTDWWADRYQATSLFWGGICREDVAYCGSIAINVVIQDSSQAQPKQARIRQTTAARLRSVPPPNVTV